MMADAAEEERALPGEDQQLNSPSGGTEHTQPAAPTEDTEEQPGEDQQQPQQLSSPPGGTEDAQPAAPIEEQQQQLSSPPGGTKDAQPAAPTEGTEERAAEVGAARPQRSAISVESSLDQFKIRKFFVLRPGTLNQAIKDVEALLDEEVDGSVHSVWLLAEVDHWNNEKERLAFITDNSLLVFKYDFIMFNCEQVQRIPLNIIDRISHGKFIFPKHTLLQRGGEGVRVFWDRLREPSFTSRWNPFAVDFPFNTFTDHPVRNISDTFAALCDIQKFREELKDAAQKAHAKKPFPGKANGVLVLNHDILIETYVGLMSFLGNQNKLGYCMARGTIGF
ncbi:tumor protein p63-regulated gene 1 protein isoform X1 [Sebastes umbrosus]|uniref:tumor protein p63-regulated gene 1 protein isoform X1 n=1 Tax=Sebastes umbrosus TaxID=72105 RepID=UPI00189E781A|nr:tumor protein p63-regulated gene 1 protein isoform X1 [Sebastes umbrosus]XP_037624919.1 tumor protein p63-regulated gene 1 protein isoform X1 [Sebastes umbrosus]